MQVLPWTLCTHSIFRDKCIKGYAFHAGLLIYGAWIHGSTHQMWGVASGLATHLRRTSDCILDLDTGVPRFQMETAFDMQRPVPILGPLRSICLRIPALPLRACVGRRIHHRAIGWTWTPPSGSRLPLSRSPWVIAVALPEAIPGYSTRPPGAVIVPAGNGHMVANWMIRFYH